MPSRIVDARQEQAKRDLRLRIGRLRRRIDARIRGAEGETRRLLSWRTYVKRYPGSAVMAALGVGLAVSAGLSARRLSRWAGLRMIRRAADQVLGHLRRDLARIWADSTPKSATRTGGARDDRA